MKVKEFAEQQGVSSQAVYQRINGLKRKTKRPLSDYIEPKTNELTGECLELLTTLYREKKQIKEIPSKGIDDQLNEAKQTIEKLELERQALQKEVDSQKQTIERLVAQISELRNDKQFLQTLASNLSKNSKQSFIRRLFAGKGSGTASDTSEKK